MTRSMKAAIAESSRRRKIQQEYNEKHGITPESVKREVTKSITNLQKLIAEASKRGNKKRSDKQVRSQLENPEAILIELETRMAEAAEKLDFETAIKLRNEWLELKKDQSK